MPCAGKEELTEKRNREEVANNDQPTGEEKAEPLGGERRQEVDIMWHSSRRFLSGFVAVAAALVVMAALAAPSQAQVRPIRGPIVQSSFNGVRVVPSFGQASWVTPYVRLNQAAYATAVYGQAMSYVPPWTYGYNPYPRVVNSYGAPYPYSPPVYYPNYYYGANPYYGGYYSAPYVGSYVTPYLYGGYYP
jgi:hypothetical protein